MTVKMGERYLRCPKLNLIIEHIDCHHCNNMVSIRLGAWHGDVGRRTRHVTVQCLIERTRRSIGTMRPDETERLSNL